MNEGLRILVVEDEPSVRLTLTAFLSRSGYVMEEAKDGEEALAKLPAFNPHVILLDIRLPGIMDGLDLCRRIRMDHEYDMVVILMMTAVSDVAIVTQAIQAGAADYIAKPFKPETMLEKIKKHLRAVWMVSPEGISTDHPAGVAALALRGSGLAARTAGGSPVQIRFDERMD